MNGRTARDLTNAEAQEAIDAFLAHLQAIAAVMQKIVASLTGVGDRQSQFRMRTGASTDEPVVPP